MARVRGWSLRMMSGDLCWEFGGACFDRDVCEVVWEWYKLVEGLEAVTVREISFGWTGVVRWRR